MDPLAYLRSCFLLMTIDYQGDGIIDNKQAIQVHDYLGVSFFRMDSKQRSTTKQIVDLMSKVCFNKSAGAYIKHHFLTSADTGWNETALS